MKRKDKNLIKTLLFGLFLATAFNNCSPGFQQVYSNENSSLNEVFAKSYLGSLNFQCLNPDSRGILNSKFKRFTKLELTNTLRDLLGTSLFNDSQVQSALASVKDENIAKDLLSLADSHVYSYTEGLYQISQRIGAMLATNAAERGRLLATCAEGASISDTCAQQVIQDFGLRVMRRPLTEEQKTSYFNFFNSISSKNNNNTQEGLKAVVMRFLASPYMSFHVEVGNNQIVGNRIRLNDYEIASRISYRIAATMPDRLLLQAAQRGELQSLDQVKSHAQRLLNFPSARQKADMFFSYYANLELIEPPNSFVAQLNGINTNGLVDEMKVEALDFINNVVWTRNGNFADLMTSNEVFPKTDRLAKIVGSGISSQGRPVLAKKSNSGLFLRPAILSSQATRTDIIHRGLNFRKRYLCSTGNGAPPSDISSAAKGIDFDNMTNRAGIDKMTSNPACINCHRVFNPIGYVLEGHNQLGMIRENEPFFDTNGNVIKTFPVDTKVSESFIDYTQDTPLSGASDMIDKFATSENAKACFTAKAFTFYNARKHDTFKDGCALSEAKAISLDGSIQSLLQSVIATEDIFWKAAPL
jgi:hypothetical protein